MTLTMKHVCVIAFSLVLICKCVALNYENITRLKTDMLNGYDSEFRPINNHSGMLDLTVGASLFYILEVDTLKGTLTTVLSFSCSWLDERITWTPSDYGGIDSIMIQQQHTWVPPLTLALGAEVALLGEKWMHVTYQSSGFAIWTPSSVSVSTCAMNMKYWPFDEQTCEQSFFPYDFFRGGIRITVSHFTVGDAFENGEWSVTKTKGQTIGSGSGFTGAAFTMTLKRRPVFHVLALILPMFLTCILTGFVFLLPSDSGERVGFSITILLALTVFLTIISDNIPKLSNPVPILSIGLLTGVIMSGFTTIAVMLNLAIFHRDPETPVGQWYVAFVRIINCRSNRVKNDDTIIEVKTNLEAEKPKIMEDPTEYDDYGVTWKDVSYAIDRVLYVVVTFLQVLPILVLLIIFNSY